MFNVQYKTISPTEASARQFSLDGSAVTTSVALDTIGGTAQSMGSSPDFALDGTVVKWNDPSYGLYSQLSANDVVRVIYDKAGD